MQVNFACLTPKGIRGMSGENFFRANTLETNSNFQLASFTGFQRRTRAINADRYIIWWHKRFELGPIANGNALSAEVRKNIKKLNFYTKINQPRKAVIYCRGTPKNQIILAL
jgi:hypothetical protein